MKKWLIRQLVKWMTPRLRFIWHDVALWRYVESRGYHVTLVIGVGAGFSTHVASNAALLNGTTSVTAIQPLETFPGSDKVGGGSLWLQV